MRKSLWVMAAIGLVGMIALMVLSQTALKSIGGIEETSELQELLRGAYGHLVKSDPPLVVQRVPGSAEWPGFRWKVEATLQGNWRTGSNVVVTGADRMAGRSLATTVQGRRASGVMVLLHSAGQADLLRLYDGEGMYLSGGRPPTAPPKDGPK